ncbi:hypothetical protein ACIBO5_13325 [Nonomuraea angiospora]|uniref:hypothetical protein n=1 Tax=Nonomuraea angiospora TaxID=46172 RepID=UPI0029ABE780|nr:hypothetical protein [Nonomuraea angiospora]MDX3105653.1 hypothetical protein [Nonomuraea angiospora]
MDALRRALGGLSLLYALIFLSFGLLHAGISFGPVREPVIVPAAIVETLCAAAMFAGAYGVLAGRGWAWDGLIYSHSAALGGVLMGILSLALGAGPSSALLSWYHSVTAVLLAAGLAGSFYASRVRGATAPGSGDSGATAPRTESGATAPGSADSRRPRRRGPR